jgi:hypothetical protein
MAAKQYTVVVPLTFTCIGTSQTGRTAIKGKGGGEEEEEPVHSSHKYTGLKCGSLALAGSIMRDRIFSCFVLA